MVVRSETVESGLLVQKLAMGDSWTGSPESYSVEEPRHGGNRRRELAWEPLPSSGPPPGEMSPWGGDVSSPGCMKKQTGLCPQSWLEATEGLSSTTPSPGLGSACDPASLSSQVMGMLPVPVQGAQCGQHCLQRAVPACAHGFLWAAVFLAISSTCGCQPPKRSGKDAAPGYEGHFIGCS